MNLDSTTFRYSIISNHVIKKHKANGWCCVDLGSWFKHTLYAQTHSHTLYKVKVFETEALNQLPTDSLALLPSPIVSPALWVRIGVCSMYMRQSEVQ